MDNFEPTVKHPLINAFINDFTGKDREATIRAGLCMTCDKGLVCQEIISDGLKTWLCEVDADNHRLLAHRFIPFRDILSTKEYTIGGMCQACQDSVFGS